MPLPIVTMIAIGVLLEGQCRLSLDSSFVTNHTKIEFTDMTICKSPTISNQYCNSDADCPAGKVCYAGTDCKYVSDLHPTETPTPAPSISPTTSPLVYDTIENTRFCGTGWEDAQKNCQISRHCPSGKDTECPSGMTCFGWMSGCNIIDMREYLDANGVEIVGSDRVEMDPILGADSTGGNSTTTYGGAEGGNIPTLSTTTNYYVEGDSTDNSSMANDYVETEYADSNTTTSTDMGPPPSLSLTTWTPQPNPVVKTPPPIWTASPVQPSTSSPVVPIDPENAFHPEHHVFCGASWLDAQARCSEETFCSDGAATHVCTDEGDFCWVGITACDAGDWLFSNSTQVSSSPIMAEVSSVPMAAASLSSMESFVVPTPPPAMTFDNVTSDATIAPVASDSVTLATEVSGDRFTVRQSFCAENYIHLIDECLTLDTCNESLCPDGLSCFKNVLCTSTDNEQDSVTTDTIETPAPINIDTPTTPAPLTPLPSPFFAEDTPFPVVASEISSSPVLSLLLTSTATPSLPPDYELTFSPESQHPTQQPTILTISAEEVAQRMSSPNNYCATSLDQILMACSYSLKTCNDGEPMCPLGTNCFGNVVCPGPTTAPITQPPVVVPVVITTLEPTFVLVDDSSSVDPAAQSYCAENEGVIQSTCKTALTCNDGFGTCPVGLFCFENVVCEAFVNQTDLIEPLPTSSTEAPKTVSPTTSSSETSTTSAPPAASNDGQGSVGNYCAESESMLQATCKTAVICNEGFGTCPVGFYCFSHVVCEALQAQNDEAANLADGTQSTRAPADLEECNNLCLVPLDPGECDSILSLGLNILPCSSMSGPNEMETGMDQVCAATGKCGTSLDLNNCDGSEDLYMRIDVSTCIASGIGSSGVLASDFSQSASTVASIQAPETTQTEAVQTHATEVPGAAASVSNIDRSQAEDQNPQPDSSLTYSWEDPAKNNTRDEQAEIDGWWIKKELDSAYGKQSFQMLCVLIACIMILIE
ncbi:hypothetical protein ACHAWX_004794 [Stephanocyclus meneghinianus]